jgi:3-phosphoshikimate 1-carboxyvinyltransferase
MKDIKDARVAPAAGLAGTVTVPGDKSISHRAACLGCLSGEGIEVTNYSNGEDCKSTLRCLEQLGFSVVRGDSGVRVRRGNGPCEAPVTLDAGNSGTTARLLCGLLSGIPGAFSVITGDESLSRRPMSRVVDPLRNLGARIDGREGGRLLPLSVRGTRLTGGTCTLSAASAQVKTALMIAGLRSQGSVTVIEPLPTRDHTEIMLEHLGVPIRREDKAVTTYPFDDLPGGSWRIPGDFSSAAFWIVAAAIVPGSELSLPGVGLNPTRTGLLEAMKAMGLSVAVENAMASGGEPAGTLRVRSSRLEGTRVVREQVPLLVDELPILAVAATQARGVTEIRGAEELRVKECDRIAAMAEGLAALGADIEAHPDGWTIRGPRPLKGGRVNSHGDHRIAMALAVAALAADGPVQIGRADCVEISYPGFFTDLERISGGSAR